jgi:Domain of unknown function (DUF4263)
VVRKQDRKRSGGNKTGAMRAQTNALDKFDLPIARGPLLAAFPASQEAKAIDATGAAKYLERYIQMYRKRYEHFVAKPPDGQGYPDLRISPYLYSTNLTCSLAYDGYVLWDGWDSTVTDGPFTVNPPDHRKEPEILAQTGRLPPMFLVHNEKFSEYTRRGLPPNLLSQKRVTSNANVLIDVSQYALSFLELLSITCFGSGQIAEFFGKSYAESIDNFWIPFLVRNWAFTSQSGGIVRYFHYLEVSNHVEPAAWDTRSIWVRVGADITRDFRATVESKWGWGSFHIPKASPVIVDRLSSLADAISGLEILLKTDQDSDEKVFHDFLYAHPVLIDVYGWVVSKPRWRYPEGKASPVGKTYLEPDFVVCYPGGRYKLVEIEKPSKRLATEKGHPRSEVGQAVNQLSEWKHFLKYHAESIRDEFPNIGMDFSSMLVISRSSAESVGLGRDIEAVEELYAMWASVGEFYTYDKLLTRAQVMYERLAAISSEPGKT